MANSNKTKLSLSDIFNSHLDKVDAFDKEYVKKHGFLLIISLSGAEKKASKLGADTYGLNNGYVTKPRPKTDSAVTVPFLTSWRGFGLQPDNTGAIKMYEYDEVGRNLEDPALRTQFEGVPINWKVNFSDEFIKRAFGFEKKDSRMWKECTDFLAANQRAQLQMLIVKSCDPTKGAGELRRIPLMDGSKTGSTVRLSYDISLVRSDVFTNQVVTPGPSYLEKVDRPTAVMEKLHGLEVDENEITKVVNTFSNLNNKVLTNKLEQEIMKASEKVAQAQVEEVAPSNDFETSGM